MLKLSAYVLNYTLQEPISISFHTFYHEETILIKLEDESGLYGWGEASPFLPITGDSQEQVLREFASIAHNHMEPYMDSIASLHDFLDRNTNSQTLKAAIDFAWYDYTAKKQGIPVYKMYTKMPRLVSNSVTVFVHDDPQETARDAQEFFQQFPELKLLKIKLAGNENDVETALRIKEVAPDGMQFTLDANQGFKDPSKAVDILGKVKNVLENVDYIEEPCPKGELDMLAYVKNNIKNMWVIADESAATLADVEKIIAAKAAHGVNIKLEKAGGIWQGRQIAELCLKNNLKVMVGCMMERGIGIAAGIHFVASTPNVVFSDLDGDLYGELCTTPISPFIKGCRVPIGKPGFGIEPDLKLIEKAQKKGSVSFFNPHDSGVTT